jgi:hypothetical protein
MALEQLLKCQHICLLQFGHVLKAPWIGIKHIVMHVQANQPKSSPATFV